MSAIINMKEEIAYENYWIEFTNAYGDIDEQFYKNIAGAYADALKYVFDNDLKETFKDTAYSLMNDYSLNFLPSPFMW